MKVLRGRLQLQMLLLNATHRYFQDNNYDNIVSPKIVPFKDDEINHLIKVKINGRDEEVFLSRSPQLYKEIACLNSQSGKVYEVGPVFRGEPEGNLRRANEFVGIDVELKTNELSDILSSLEGYIHTIGDDSKLRDYLKNQKITPGFPTEIIRIPYYEALKQINSKKIGAEEEKKLYHLVNKNSNNKRWIILTEFPASSRGFYQINGEVTDSFDLISEWEICSGGLRRNDIENYFKLLEDIGWSTKEMELYKQIKSETQNTNTGGYGIGLERLAGAIIGKNNIGEIQPYKRIPEEKIRF